MESTIIESSTHSSNGINSTKNTSKAVIGINPNGMRFARVFTTSGVPPFASLEWEERRCSITNDRGDELFIQEGVRTPKSWSQMASTVVASKYFYGAPGTEERERGVDQLISRVVSTVTAWAEKDGYFSAIEAKECFSDELAAILVTQRACFNSPVWFNVGVREHPQCSACFILSVDDSLDSLLDLQTRESRIFKYGSGAGTNFSSVRSSRERLSGGGVPSGPVSFMRAYDAWAGTIKSGGKTRRAAKMLILNAEHPDVMEFIRAKPDEERKAWALIDSGYDGSFAVRGGAYDSVGFQNANLSVRVSDEFMQAVVDDRPYWTKKVKDGAPCEKRSAREVLQAISAATHLCGDPGLQFDSTINDWHTVPESGRINASNPCSEYMSVDDSACNLASINLLKFLREDGSFAIEEYEHVVRVMITAQDSLVDNSSYPTQKIGKNARSFRQLGLGYTNLGALLMTLGIPYDSEEARGWAAALTSIMTGQAYVTSAELARTRGPFEAFRKNRSAMLGVIEKHRRAAEQLDFGKVPSALSERARAVWGEALQAGKRHGFRNSQTTVLAPTGTISFMMDCDTTGVEPELGLVKYKKLSDGGMMTLVNRSVVKALQRLGYAEQAIANICREIESKGTIEGCPDIKPEHLPIFDCALKPAKGDRFIHYRGHLAMMAATQPFLSGAISKTVNLPRETTPEEISAIYIDAWKSGLKAVALYRDGSKRTQPLNMKKDAKAAVEGAQPVRRKLPDERPSVTHRFVVGGLEGYLTVGLYENGAPGEIFLVVAKEGSTLSGVMDAFATSISMALQYGVPLAALVRKFSHVRFEPAGFTGNEHIPLAKSIVDYVFRWMGLRFLGADEQKGLGLVSAKAGDHAGADAPSASGVAHKDDKAVRSAGYEDAPPCANCGSSLMVRQANCYVCLNCGTQGGCG